jgi:hypothetical protein
MPYFIEPEVSGQLGERTIIDTSTHPPVLKYLHFIFFGWLGDDLIECFPVFLITEKLKSELGKTKLTGYQIGDCVIELSEEFKLLQPGATVPTFYWFQITGRDQDDFTILKNKMKISDYAYSVLSQFSIENAIVEAA